MLNYSKCLEENLNLKVKVLEKVFTPTSRISHEIGTLIVMFPS